MKKDDITTRYENGSWVPAVNVKSYAGLRSVPLPLDLGGVSEDGGKTWQAVTTDAGFTHDWIERNVSGSDSSAMWEWACQDGWEQAETAAAEVFGSGVKVYSAGRSGGWLIVEGLDPIESWDAIMVSRWGRFEKQVDAIADDNMRRTVWNIWANVYEPRLDEAERIESDLDDWSSLA